MKISCFAPLLLLVLLCAACSSTPKRPMAYSDVSSRAYDAYEKANGALTRGDYETAGRLLEESYNQAVSIDKNELICKVLLSAVTLRMSENDESAAIPSLFSEAKVAASLCDDSTRQVLESVIVIYECRAELHDSQKTGSRTGGEAYISRLKGQEKGLSKEPYYQAFLYRTKGDWQLWTGDFDAAADSYRQAADIHTKNRYLYELAYDWYLCASACSQGGKKTDALEAIEKALKYDKDAENTAGIAMDYRAAAAILRKGNASSADLEQAAFYESRADDIMRAGFLSLSK